MSDVDESWRQYWQSNGTFSFESDEEADVRETRIRLEREADIQERLRVVYKGQNRLLRKVAEAVDAAFPPDEYGNGHGTGHIAPGDIVRQFIVKPAEEMIRGEVRGGEDPPGGA